MKFPIQFRSDEIVHEVAEMESKISAGIATLTSMKDDDVDIGSTPKDVFYARETFQVYHYKPLVDKDKIHPVPMLVSTPLINGYEVADLQPDRSLVRNFLKEGIDVYMINWGYPKRCDRYNNIDDYVTDYIDDIADKVIENSGADKINLFGICMGGTLATCYSALWPEKVRNLVLTVTPIDFDQYKVEGQPHVGLLFAMGKSANVDAMVDAFGNVPADVLNVSFLMASPFTLMFGKYVGNKQDYKELPIKTGHIGIYTGGASQKILAPAAAKWLKEH